ncbi:elongation factor EF-2 [Candidatus Woesearchaeota archaeon CG10_big_fil_rev_8_21_14_0_10_44_13]|nr:MAG: elongation factor EF-2 [Candidatus Woesearchaeota archaeon CG10_big_fil_rev_8_21_14_0_10_44_13]
MAEKMVEKIERIRGQKDRIRNIAICAHIDHGKTTFSDNLLAGAGMISEELAGKQRFLDFAEDEQARGITIDAANVSMVHEFDKGEYLINLIDTPGHVDFGGDVTRAMRASDGCIVLSCAVEGVMPQTETVLRQALKERVKPTLFINKVDRLIKELQLTPEKMQERFIKIITHVNKLIKEIAEKEYGDKFQVSVNEGSVCFGSAFHKWALSLPYMKKSGITFKDVIDAYNNDTWKELAKKAPLHKVVLNMVIGHLPSPAQAQPYRIPKIWKGDLESEEGQALVKCDGNGPLFFVITKIVIDPQAGEISAGRLFSGTIRKGMDIYLNRRKMPSRIQQVFIYNGAKREIVDNVPCGNVIGIAGVKSAPGETITNKPTVPFEEITHLFEPVVTKSIEAKRPSDLPKLIEVLRMVQKEDPGIRVKINEETGEHLISGMGELHLEVIENRIRTNKGVEVTTSPPIVVYRESITKKCPQEVEGKSPNKHNKLYFLVEPLDADIIALVKKNDIPEGRIKKMTVELRDKFTNLGWETKIADKVKDIYKGNLFVDETKGIIHIGEIMEMLLDMFEDVMENGPLAREPCFGVKVRLMDCTLHEDTIHRGPAQMYPAIREGIREAMRLSGPMLFEPVQTLQFEAPPEYMGEISKLIANKRGQLVDMNQDESRIMVIGKLPVAAMFGLASDLRSSTEGRGNYSLVDQNFEKMPFELQEKTIKQIRERKGLSENQ